MTWIQPKNQQELLLRLADARDLAVSERERENLCACAYTEIKRLQQETLDLHAAGCAESERADVAKVEHVALSTDPRSTRLCGAIIHVGDTVKVRYTTGERLKGGSIAGVVTKIWPFQAQVNNGWCFHDSDELLEHTRGEV